MNIAYVANIRIPTEKAHGYQIMRVCSELARQGHQVSLYVPTRTNAIPEDPFAFYGVEKNFSLILVPCFDWIRFVKVFGPLAFRLQMISFVRALRAMRIAKDTLVYTRDAEVVWALGEAGYSCVYNAHNWSTGGRAQRLLARVKGVVCNSAGTEEAVRADMSVPTVVASNASDSNPYLGYDKTILRKELGLPQDSFLVMYAGHLYGWKGAHVLLEAAKVTSDMMFVFVGGTIEDVAWARKEYENVSNILILGHRPKTEVPKYLAAADALVLPNVGSTEESIKFTSPLKLFEYIASGVPVVASDLPSVRSVIGENEVFFFPPGNVEALANVLGYIQTHSVEAQSVATRALEVSGRYTWDAHVRNLITFFQSVL